MSKPWLWQYFKTFGSNFGVVEEGKVYRSALPTNKEIRRYRADFGLKTILDLRREKTILDLHREETAMARMEMIHWDVIYRHAALDDHGPVEKALIDECVEVISNPTAWPILVHCQGGRHRTGVVIATYRIKKCGWTAEQARAEAYRFGMYRHNHEAWADYLENLL